MTEPNRAKCHLKNPQQETQDNTSDPVHPRVYAVGGNQGEERCALNIE